MWKYFSLTNIGRRPAKYVSFGKFNAKHKTDWKIYDTVFTNGSIIPLNTSERSTDHFGEETVYTGSGGSRPIFTKEVSQGFELKRPIQKYKI